MSDRKPPITHKPFVSIADSVTWKPMDVKAAMKESPDYEPGPSGQVVWHPMDVKAAMAKSPDYVDGPSRLPPPELFSQKVQPTVVRSERYACEPVARVLPFGPEADRYEVEVTRFRNGLFVRAPSTNGEQSAHQELRLCQDAGALGLDEEGCLARFAMGDGVSQSLDGGVAARRATAAGLDLLTKYASVALDERTLQTLLRQAEAEMQRVDLAAMKDEWLDQVLALPMPDLLKNSLLEKLGYRLERGGKAVPYAPKRSIGDSGLSSTTLAMGCVQENRLKMMWCGDGGWFTLRAAGGMVCGQDKEGGSPAQVRLAGDRVDPDDLVYESHELRTGDITFCYSDGLFLSQVLGGKATNAELARHARALFDRGLSLERVVHTLLGDAIGGDDNSILAFVH